MGLPVPTMVMPTNPPPPYPKPPHPKAPPPLARAQALASCKQCGGPQEVGTSVCGYCLSPRSDLGPVDVIEVTEMGDSMRRFIPGPHPTPIYR